MAGRWLAGGVRRPRWRLDPAGPLTPPTAEAVNVESLGPFSFRWPDGEEQFEGGWAYDLKVSGEIHKLRHGIGGRVVYGRWRVHTVTWVDGEVQVEGVEADDYPSTSALLSGMRRADKSFVRTLEGVADDYAGFEIVDHRREIDAKGSRNILAVKVRQDDLAGWGLHAWLRQRLHSAQPAVLRATTSTPNPLPSPPPANQMAVIDGLLAHGRALAAALGGAKVRFTSNEEANALIYTNPFAFLVAVISDQGILAERAWAIPFELQRRLGYLDPRRITDTAEDVKLAFATPPKLHRFVNDIAGWVVSAADIVLDQYGADASRIWNDNPSAAKLRARFDAFPGIGQKKAAMAVEILERDLHVPLTQLMGSDIAYDVHVRRVFPQNWAGRA